MREEDYSHWKMSSTFWKPEGKWTKGNWLRRLDNAGSQWPIASRSFKEQADLGSRNWERLGKWRYQVLYKVQMGWIQGCLQACWSSEPIPALPAGLPDDCPPSHESLGISLWRDWTGRTLDSELHMQLTARVLYGKQVVLYWKQS